MSNEIGRRAGEMLGAYGESLQLAGLIAEEDLARELLQRKAERTAVERQAADLSARRNEAAVRRDELLGLVTELDRRRWTSPQEFSLTRGTIFLFLAVLLILADLSIIGQVAARFLGYEWFTKGGKSFSKTLFTSPLEAYRNFPDLLFLSLALLLIGFFAKAFLDALVSWRTREPGERRGQLPYLVLYALAIMFSVLTLFYMARVRNAVSPVGTGQASTASVQASSNPQDEQFKRHVWVLLGISLPVVATAFFVKGFECMARRARLGMVRIEAQRAAARTRTLARRERDLTARLESLKDEAAALTDGPLRNGYLARRRFEFTEGYRSGLVGTLFARASNEPLFDRLRPALFDQLRRRGKPL